MSPRKTNRDAGTPINVILADHTIVLVWIVRTEAIRQFTMSDMEQAEVEFADFEAIILDKQSGLISDFPGATFELGGNSYIIDDVSKSPKAKKNEKSVHFSAVAFTARSYFPQ